MNQHHTSSTDQTVPALDLSDRTDSLPTHDTVGRSHRSRRLIVAAVALALAAGGVGVVALGGGSSSTPKAAATSTVTGLPGAVNAGADTVPAAPTNDGPQGGPGGPAQPQPQPPAEPPAAPGVLKVNTTAIHLLAGHYSASFTVRNDGGSPLDWTWQGGIPGIAVSQSGGALAPGESTVVSFTINPFQLPEGGFAFLNYVKSGDTSRALTITGVRTPIVVNPNIPQGPQTIKP
jgi:hypothetical protein